MGSITTFPIPTTPVSGLVASTVFAALPAAGDLFAGVQIANTAQALTGSLVKYTWATLMTSVPLTGNPTIAAGTATTAVSPLSITQTWNNGAVTFPGVVFNVTDTTSVATSKFLDLQVSAASKFSVDKAGTITNAGNIATAGNVAIVGTLDITGNTTVTQLTASTKLATNTTGVTNGIAVADSTTSAAISFAPKGLGIKGYIGADKAGTLVPGSSDGDIIILATSTNIIFRTAGSVRIDTVGNIQNFAGGITSYQPTGNGIGYGSGAGGTITQGTNRTTAVTLNTLTGQVITATNSLAAGNAASFQVNNSQITAFDTVNIAIAGGKVQDQTVVSVSQVLAGSFFLTVYTPTSAAGAETGAIKVNYTVIRGVTS